MRHTGIDQETAKGLKVLRSRIEQSGVPSSILDEQILLASWNIREFGRKRKGEWRKEKSIHYIAEILSYFDLVSLQELRGDLNDLRRVMEILGPYWKVVFSDVTRGRRGNQERIAYLYDKRAVAFTGLAAEAVAPPIIKKRKGKRTVLPAKQFWRTPYIASFRAGSFDFVLLSVHVLWGKEKQDRVKELRQLANWVEEYRRSKFSIDKDILVMGDFNMPKFKDKFYEAITSRKLRIPPALLEIKGGSNLDRKARYDQMFHYPKHSGSAFTPDGGVVDFYQKDHKALFPRLTKRQFTYQLSDHLPLWIKINTYTAEEELDQILNPPRKRPKKKRRKPKAK